MADPLEQQRQRPEALIVEVEVKPMVPVTAWERRLYCPRADRANRCSWRFRSGNLLIGLEGPAATGRSRWGNGCRSGPLAEPTEAVSSTPAGLLPQPVAPFQVRPAAQSEREPRPGRGSHQQTRQCPPLSDRLFRSTPWCARTGSRAELSSTVHLLEGLRPDDFRCPQGASDRRALLRLTAVTGVDRGTHWRPSHGDTG